MHRRRTGPSRPFGGAAAGVKSLKWPEPEGRNVMLCSDRLRFWRLPQKGYYHRLLRCWDTKALLFCNNDWCYYLLTLLLADINITTLIFLFTL